MIYINTKTTWGIETVDEFTTRKEAIEMLKEYNYSDPYNSYYLSSRSTKEWRESKQ